MFIFVRESGFKLIAENLDEFPPGSACGYGMFGHANAVVLDLDCDRCVVLFDKEVNPAVVLFVEGVFDGIGDHFVDDQPHGDGLVDIDLEIFAVVVEADIAIGQRKCRLEIRAKVLDIRAEGDLPEVLGLVKLVM